jgi:HPt (histidine-containing phosphotransfer) domain-containing protein
MNLPHQSQIAPVPASACVRARAQESSHLVSADPAAASPLDAATTIDVAELLQRCSGDTNFAGRMLRKFQHRVAGEVERIKAAVSAHDAPAARKVVHTLCGTAGNLSASGLHRITEEFEALIKNERIEEVRGNLECLETEVDRLLETIGDLLVEWEGESGSGTPDCEESRAALAL